MKRRTLIHAALILTVILPAAARASDWIFDAAPYTNNPLTGQRVEQYQKKVVPKPLSYDKFFSPNGPGAYIPPYYYEQEGMWGGPWGYGYGMGGFGFATDSFAFPTYGGVYAF